MTVHIFGAKRIIGFLLNNRKSTILKFIKNRICILNCLVLIYL